jgi:hypothetical protein
MPDQNSDEFAYAAKLDNRHRGQLAEIAFVRKATALGFAVAKPWGEGERYDFIVRVQNVCWRVQVKSVLAKSRGRSHYRLPTSSKAPRCPRVPYSAEQIDFLVGYIFQEDAWYVLPARVIADRTMICVNPGSKRSRFEQYRDAWHLMQPAAPEAADKARTATAGT